MNPLFRIPIRLQLIFIVAIVAFPAAGILIYSGIQMRNNATNDARMETQRIVDRVASEQNILATSALQLVVAVSHLSEVRATDVVRVNQFLRNNLKVNRNFDLIFVADRLGTIWASSVPFANIISISDRRYFINAIMSGQLSSGEFQISRVTFKPSFLMGYPFKNNHGETIGVICVEIPLENYADLMKQAHFTNRANMTLIDHNGIILVSTTDPVGRTGKSFNQSIFKKMQNGADAGTELQAGVDGDSQQKYYVSYQKLYLDGEKSPYMYIQVGIPVKSVLSQAKIQILRNLSLLTFVLALALFLAWFVGKRSIADRINLMKIASRSLANGTLNVRISDLVKGGELGELSESFDAMAQQLTSRERFLNTIIDTEPECLKMLDADGRVQMMNPAGLKLIDAESFEQVKGQCIYPLISAKYLDAFVELTNGVFKGVSGNLEFEVVGFKGRHVWLNTHAVPFKNDVGEIVSLLGITRDITDRTHADQALQHREADLRKAQEIAKLGSWSYAMPDLISWSDELYRIYGVSPETFTPTFESFLNLIHPDDRSAMKAWIEACVADEKPRELEFRVIWPDGAVRFISCRGELMYDGDGLPSQICGTAQDITERKRSEVELAEKQRLLEELNISLEKRVSEAVFESRKKDQILISQGRQAAMGEMIGNIAHQWRQPLNTLGLIVQELKMTYPHDDFFKEILDANVSKAMSLILHMSKTIDDFGNYFKPDKEKMLFKANTAVTKALTLVEPSLANLNIHMEIIENAEAFINGYANEYSQVLLNISTFAVRKNV